MKKSILDLEGFEDICNEFVLVLTYAGCDSNWLKAQYQRTNGDYVNSQVVAGEQSRQEAIAYYGGGEGGK